MKCPFQKPRRLMRQTHRSDRNRRAALQQVGRGRGGYRFSLFPSERLGDVIRMNIQGLLACIGLSAAFAITGAEKGSVTINLLVLGYDPILHDHGGVKLSRFMKWNDPRSMTTNLVRHFLETSG